MRPRIDGSAGEEEWGSTGAKWQEEWYTAVGFPRVFYLRYHGYSAYFPVWALTRYRNLLRGNAPTTRVGM